jgi:hypothetical protein
VPETAIKITGFTRIRKGVPRPFEPVFARRELAVPAGDDVSVGRRSSAAPIWASTSASAESVLCPLADGLREVPLLQRVDRYQRQLGLELCFLEGQMIPTVLRDNVVLYRGIVSASRRVLRLSLAVQIRRPVSEARPEPVRPAPCALLQRLALSLSILCPARVQEAARSCAAARPLTSTSCVWSGGRSRAAPLDALTPIHVY